MDVTRERISHILELWEILLSIQTGFILVIAAVVCAILESISGLESSSVITEPRYLKLWLSQASVHSLWSLCWCHWCCLSSAWSSRHWSPCRRLWRLCQDAQLKMPGLLPLLLSHQCHHQSGGWWLFFQFGLFFTNLLIYLLTLKTFWDFPAFRKQSWIKEWRMVKICLTK